MNKSEFAKRLLYDRNYVTAVENGDREPGPRFVQQIEMLEREIESGLVSEHGRGEVSVHESTGAYNDPRSILKRAREGKGWSPEDLAKIARVPAAFIRKVESGELRGSNEKELRKLAKALKLDPDELLRGSDHPTVQGEGEHISTFGATPKVALTDKLTAKTIPLISMAQAGDLREWEDVYDYEGVIAYAGRDPRAIAVRIRGESMSPDYGPGTIAILYPSFLPKNDNLVVAKTRDGNVLFKRLQILGGELIFHSINPKYEPMKYTERDIVWMYPVGLTQRVEL